MPSMEAGSLQGNYTAYYFNQQLDHTVNGSATWQQKYFLDVSAYKPGGPIFFFLGGEAPLEFFTYELPQIGETVNLAHEFGGAFVGLEHRFYGNMPVKGGMLTVDNLKYLSVEQALADAAAFREFIAKKLASDVVVVTGVSYSGALAAYARLKYPSLYVAAYASSGVVEAILDFVEYGQQSAADVTSDCRLRIYDGIQTIDDIMGIPDSGTRLQELFNPCGNVTVENPVPFLYTLGGDLIGPAQEAQESETVCPFFQDGDNLVNMVNFFHNGTPYAECVPIFEVASLQDTNPANNAVGGRQWFWQKCTQWGFFKDAAPIGASFEPQWINLTMHYDLCEEIFGEAMQPDVDAFNAKYEGKNTTVTKVVFINGGEDPWHHCSILESNSAQDIVAFVTPGVGHGRETLPPSPNDPPAVIKARQVIHDAIASWL